MDVSFDELADDFFGRIERIVWCTVATVDARGRPRSRLLHPIWERPAGAAGPVGWIATGRDSHKARHLAANPFVSCTYWDPQHQQVYADCEARWVDDPDEKQRLWDLYNGTPPPLGYDLALFWRNGPGDPTYGLLRLDPWRVEVSALADMMTGAPPRVWRPQG
ncbi:MAG: pyridoxamine 5'-phosphate oxidase family protein [Acidimicrobiales bacterium]|nr:pyridoxamine 5'-phosphate oxidase family protein [Acidimicrobiales bacterium]